MNVGRFFYTVLFFLLFPIVVLRLLWRGMRFPVYRLRVRERFGFYPFSLQQSIWIHAVSGGEVIAIRPVIEQCLRDFPSHPILVTTMTPTGAMQIERLFGKAVYHVYLPYDLPAFVKKFLKTMQPKIAIFVETEIWPNLLYYCQQQAIPTFLLNARLSEKSLSGYKKIRCFIQPALASFTQLAVQTQVEADRFHQLGVPYEKMAVTGSLKFDAERSPSLFAAAEALRTQLGCNRLVWVAASTHKGEEEIVLAAHQLILVQVPDALLILVPKHPERFLEVAKLTQQSFSVALRSKQAMPAYDTPVYLGDTLGELVLLYAASDLAFVGGSLVPHGGHNLLEPASVKRAVLSGKHLHNFQAISEWLTAADALTIVEDAGSLADAVLYWHSHPDERRAQGLRAEAVCLAHRGALLKQYSLVKVYL